jgi:uncharacterized membrane protein
LKIGTTRVETFSDGVIAIVITIMVLTIKTPDFNVQSTSTGLKRHIYGLMPYIITYAFSFMMIGIFWINHHHMFHLLEKTDEPLLIQNLIFLFWMSLIPLGTALIGANPKMPDSLALYGGILLMTTVTLALMRIYTIKKELVHKDKDEKVTRKLSIVSKRAKMKSIIGALAYLCAIPLAYVNIFIAYAIFLVPPVIFFIPDGIDDEKLAEKIEEKNTAQ